MGWKLAAVTCVTGIGFKHPEADVKNVFVTAYALGIAAVAASAGVAHGQIADRYWGLRMIGVYKAREAGFTGAGVRIGVMDEGIQFDHPEFADRWQDGVNGDGSPYGPPALHGTHVAGTVLGRTTGVAPGALLYGMNWNVGTGHVAFANGYRWGLANGVRIFNNSWGTQLVDPVTGLRRSLTIEETSRADIEAGAGLLLDAYYDIAAAGGVQIFSTGNSARPQPGVQAGIPYYFPDLQPHWIAVTSVGPSGDIASYAELCGVAASWCIAAPGGDGPNGSDDAIWSSAPGSSYYSINGTSMASPHVTGVMAVAAEMFPEASAPDLAQLVLQSATDIGAPGIDPVFGWGLLNLANIVSSVDPATAGSFANAAWSRFSTLGHVGQALRQRLGLPVAAGSGGGTDLGLMGYAAADSMSARGSISITDPALPGVWAMPVLGSASIAAGPSSRSAASWTAGLLAGADLIVNDTTLFGIAGGYTNTRLTSGGATDEGSADTFHLGLYGEWNNASGWFVQGTAQAAIFGQSLTRRAIAGAGGAVTPVGNLRLTGTGLEADIRAGREFALANAMTISPFVGATMRWQNTGAATETGAGIFGLTVPAAAYQQFEFGPGLRWASAPIRTERSTLQLKADVAYSRLAGDATYGTRVELLGRPINARSASIGRDIVRVGAHVNVTSLSGKYTGFAGYNGAFQRNATAHTFAAGLRASF